MRAVARTLALTACVAAPLPVLLQAPVLRAITAGRRSRSARLFVGSTPSRVRKVNRCLRPAGEDPEPGREQADAPAGLVGVDGACLTQGGDELSVHEAEPGGNPFARLAEGARGYVHSERGAEMVSDLGVGDAEAVVEIGGGGVGAGADRNTFTRSGHSSPTTHGAMIQLKNPPMSQ